MHRCPEYKTTSYACAADFVMVLVIIPGHPSVFLCGAQELAAMITKTAISPKRAIFFMGTNIVYKFKSKRGIFNTLRGKRPTFYEKCLCTFVL
jgi:hypothetical protein